VEPVVLTVVHDEAEAEIICGMLRVNGIECSHRKTDLAAGSSTIGFASGGPFELLVHEEDLVAARELLPAT
jgi:Putative prokaryotic signal transducing protein